MLLSSLYNFRNPPASPVLLKMDTVNPVFVNDAIISQEIINCPIVLYATNLNVIGTHCEGSLYSLNIFTLFSLDNVCKILELLDFEIKPSFPVVAVPISPPTMAVCI